VIVSCGIEAAGTCEGDIGAGLSFSMEMLPGMGGMGMVLAER